MQSDRDYYRILHVLPDAPFEVIRSSYRTLMQRRKAHPDLGGSHREAALLNEAWRVLRHPDRRAAYDAARSRDTGGDRGRHRPARGVEPQCGASCLFCGAGRDTKVQARQGDRCASCRSPLAPAERSRMEYRCQRAISRVRRSHPLTFRTRWPQRSGMEGRMQDISLHGLKFLSSCALAPGQIIRVDSEICRAVARVLAAQPAGSGSAAWVVRAEFLTLDLERSVGTFVSEVA